MTTMMVTTKVITVNDNNDKGTDACKDDDTDADNSGGEGEQNDDGNTEDAGGCRVSDDGCR